MPNYYWAHNGATPTTAAAVKNATGTSIKTQLQVVTPSTTSILVIEWGISFDGSSAATPIECELIDTAAITATVTSFTPQLYSNPNDEASLCVGGTAATGYNASAEGSIVASRYGDLQLVAPTGGYVKQYPLGREFRVPLSHCLRIRTTAAATVNCYCYIIWQE